MKYRKVTAIFKMEKLEAVENRLQEIGIHGLTVTKVKGYGEYADFYANDWMSTHARIEIFTTEDKAEAIAGTILVAAHSGTSGDGIVAVLPVEHVYRIRTHSEVEDDEI